jgi:hypothetical protein
MTTVPFNKFSDFNLISKVLEGTKTSINDILDKPIAIYAFKVGVSHYKTKEYATVQYTSLDISDPEQFKIKDNEKHIFFTGSQVIIDQLNQTKDKLPFVSVIRKIQKYYTLS